MNPLTTLKGKGAQSSKWSHHDGGAIATDKLGRSHHEALAFRERFASSVKTIVMIALLLTTPMRRIPPITATMLNCVLKNRQRQDRPLGQRRRGEKSD
jgi:hypothetical protein